MNSVLEIELKSFLFPLVQKYKLSFEIEIFDHQIDVKFPMIRTGLRGNNYPFKYNFTFDSLIGWLESPKALITRKRQIESVMRSLKKIQSKRLLTRTLGNGCYLDITFSTRNKYFL